MSNLADHEAEQRAITAEWETSRTELTPCERALQIKDVWEQTDDDHDNSTRLAARVLLVIAPAYDNSDTKTGIQDALSDLLHLCDLAGWDFAKMLDAARRNYLDEVHDLGLATDDALRAAIERN